MPVRSDALQSCTSYVTVTLPKRCSDFAAVALRPSGSVLIVGPCGAYSYGCTKRVISSGSACVYRSSPLSYYSTNIAFATAYGLLMPLLTYIRTT